VVRKMARIKIKYHCMYLYYCDLNFPKCIPFRTENIRNQKKVRAIFDSRKSSYEATLLLKKVAWRRPQCNKLQVHR